MAEEALLLVTRKEEVKGREVDGGSIEVGGGVEDEPVLDSCLDEVVTGGVLVVAGGSDVGAALEVGGGVDDGA